MSSMLNPVIQDDSGDANTKPEPPENQNASAKDQKEVATQIRYALYLFAASLINAIALNFESGYVGHIKTDDTDGANQMAAFGLGETFCGYFYLIESLWGGLTAQIGDAFGRGDTDRVEKLMYMAFRCAVFAGMLAWIICFPFSRIIVEWLFDVEDEIMNYLMPFIYMHMLGNFAMYIHNAAESMMQGLQQVPAFAIIYGCRGVYMAVSNYFTILHFEGGIFGEAVASASRNTLVMIACLVFLWKHPSCRQLQKISRRPSRDEWIQFLRSGGWLVIIGFVGSLSKFANPILIARLDKNEAKQALAAKTIANTLASYPHMINKVIQLIIMILGSRYLGEGSTHIYNKFLRKLLTITGAVAIIVAFGFMASAELIYSVYTDNQLILDELSTITVVLVLDTFVKIFSAVFTGMLYASQDFQKLAYVQVCCQLLIFLPVVLMVKSGIFGHIYLSTLLWIDVTVQFSQVAGMGIVVWQNMGQQLRQIIVIADYTPRWERTLGVTRGEKVMLLRDADEWLKVVRSDQSEGWIPRSYSTLDGQVSSKV